MTTESRNRPYAPPSSVIEVLHRLRSRNVPQAIDSDYLRSAGFSTAIASRILQALEFLGLINEAGQPQDSLRSLARSSDQDYKQLLDGIVRNAYSEVLEVVDLTQDTQDQIVSAFRRYEPGSQHYRMAILFLGLGREAGIPVLDEPRKREVQRAKARLSATGSMRARATVSRQRAAPGDADASVAPAQASAVLWGYFKRLPKPGSVFTPREREAWIEGMRGAFGLEYQEAEEQPKGGEA